MPSSKNTSLATCPTPSLAESWTADVDDADVAQLLIPPHAQRDRHFEVSCSLRVKALDGATEPWHALRVLVNGSQRWTRRVNTHTEGADSLDYRLRHTVPVGESLRLVAASQVQGVRRLGLVLTAEEDLDV
jgi:hypothetical protein